MRAGILSCCLSVMSAGCPTGMGQCHIGLTNRLQGSECLLHGICAAEDCHPYTEGLLKVLYAAPAV